MKQVLLAQTDTTVGFLSQDADALTRIKQRPPDKPYLKVFADWRIFSENGGRVPRSHRRFLRRAKKTTFILKNQAYRIVNSGEHHQLLKTYRWFYSTSANQSGHAFERSFCEANADIIVQDYRGFYESRPSTILRLGRQKRRRLR